MSSLWRRVSKYLRNEYKWWQGMKYISTNRAALLIIIVEYSQTDQTIKPLSLMQCSLLQVLVKLIGKAIVNPRGFR